MDRVYRTGVAVDVALRSAARRHLLARTADAGALAGLADPLHAGGTPPADPAAGAAPAAGARAPAKRALLLVAKGLWRLLRPFARPVVFRTRRYFSFELQQELRQSQNVLSATLERMSADLLREIQVSREMLRNDVAEQVNQRMKLLEQRLLARLAENAEPLQDVRRIRVELARERDLAAGARTLQADILQRIEQTSHASARRVVVPCGPDQVLLKTAAGFLVCPNSEHAVLAGLADTGELERGTRLLIGRLLAPGAVFVDVGAHLGMHTLAAGAALQGRGRIVAFEPSASTCRLLEQNVALNGYAGLTTIHEAAVGEQAGRARLYLAERSGHHSLYPVSASALEVALVRLDDVIAPGQRVDLIKIGAEGVEPAVLAGAARVLADNPGIGLIVEFGPAHLARSGHGAHDWIARFSALGLVARAIDPLSGALERSDPAALRADASVNLLFARPAAPLWSRLEPA